jgi:hypothetical protein
VVGLPRRDPVSARPGDHFQAEFEPEEDAVVLRRIAKKANWLNVLKACPMKMDDLPPRRREFPKRLKLDLAARFVASSAWRCRNC